MCQVTTPRRECTCLLVRKNSTKVVRWRSALGREREGMCYLEGGIHREALHQVRPRTIEEEVRQMSV